MTKWNACETVPADFESFWLLARRFMARNELRPREFWAIFVKVTEGRFGLERHSFDYEAFAPWVDHTADSIRYTLPGRWDVDLERTFYGLTRYCPECAIHGYHSVFHEVAWIGRCVIHGVPLLKVCRICQRIISQTPPVAWGASPRTFSCGHEWTRANLRRRGDLDLRNVRLLADWLLRVRSRSHEEHWYAVVLGPINALENGFKDYSEIGDLVTALQPLPQEIRHAVQTQWPESEMRMLAATALPADWFNESMRRIKLCATMEFGDLSPEFIPYTLQYYLHDRLEKISKAAFRDAIRGSVRVLDMSTRSEITPHWPNSVIDLIGAVFLRKLSAWCKNRHYVAAQFIKRTEVGMRFSSQSFGLLRKTRRDDELYWM